MDLHFKLMVPADHLNVFALKSQETDVLFIYVMTNRRLITNMQSTLEIEVWSLGSEVLKLFAKR